MTVLASSGIRLASEECWLASGYDVCQASAGDLIKSNKTEWGYDYPDFDKINRQRRKEEVSCEEQRLVLKEQAKELLAKPKFDRIGEAEKLLLLEQEDLDGLVLLLLLM